METGNVIRRGQAVFCAHGVAASELVWIATGFEQDDRMAFLGKPCCNRASACAGANNDIFTICLVDRGVLHHSSSLSPGVSRWEEYRAHLLMTPYRTSILS